MELSTDIENLHDFNKAQKTRSKEDCSSMQDSSEILDLSSLNLDNEETWLYEPKHNSSINTQDWLYGKCDISSNSELLPDFIVPKLKSSKTIDTRTFTRPKKKFIRPSINDYEQLYLSGSDGKDMNSSSEKNASPKWPQTVKEEQESGANVPIQPLHFDLSQPTSLHNFDSFMVNSADVDSFQNMSPPSLVNSLCSSTFANLMESSFIKNDPVLREIRDKDYTETALLQDTEAPMFQSITESCSSLNSDTPESFLKKMSFNGTFRRNISDSNSTITPENSSDNSTGYSVESNATFEVKNLTAGSNTDNKNSTFAINTTPQLQSIDESHSTKSNHSSAGNLNGTYRRTPKSNGTFRKSDLKNNRLSLNLTYEMPKENNVLDRDVSKSIENDMNNSNKESSGDVKSGTRAVILRSDSIENLKKRFSSSDLNMDLNRLSYCMEEHDNQINSTYKEEKVSNELNRTVEIKRSSLGSADSLDRMSSLSSSSKGSNKVLSMEDVEAIVEMQERSLSQVMSTPKPHGGPKKLWENNFISPIVADAKDRLSDSELSDDYKSVKSQTSSKVSLEAWKMPTTKSLGYLAVNNDLKLKTNQRSTYTTVGQRPLQALPHNIRGSYSNISTLKSTSSAIGGSHSNLFRPSSNMIRPPSTSNLKTMGTKLKGSYTSLRPISANLPVVPPAGSSLNSTQTITRRSTVNVTRTANSARMEVPPPPPRDKVVPAPAESTFVKPQNFRASGLPRPTGIPRPASRIPGPRSSIIRPPSSRNVNY